MTEYIFLVVKETQSRKVHPEKDVSSCFGFLHEAVQDAFVKNATGYQNATWVIEKARVDGSLKNLLKTTTDQYIAENKHII